MSRIKGFIKDWALPIVMAAGVAAYFLFSAAGFSAGSISNYSYLNGRAVFNVTLSNARCRIIGEFSAWYDAANAYGYGPVHAVVYDLSGNTLLSEHLEGDSMNSFYSIMRNYQN